MADFWRRKITLKIRILLYLTFNTNSNQIPRTFLWPFSLTFGLVYSPLNSAMVSCWSEVTLYSLYSTYLTFQRAKLMTSLLRVWHLRTSLNIDFDRTTNFFFHSFALGFVFWGSFNNYVHQILPNFDHLPTSSGPI